MSDTIPPGAYYRPPSKPEALAHEAARLREQLLAELEKLYFLRPAVEEVVEVST